MSESRYKWQIKISLRDKQQILKFEAQSAITKYLDSCGVESIIVLREAEANELERMADNPDLKLSDMYEFMERLGEGKN